MNEYEIVALETVIIGDNIRFSGFKLKGVAGSVDPFVDGVFMPKEIDETCDDDGLPYDSLTFLKAEMKWAKAQIGKTMECELSYRAFATNGEINFK